MLFGNKKQRKKQGRKITDNSIAVLPENNNDNVLTMLPKKVLGICSDFIVNYRN